MNNSLKIVVIDYESGNLRSVAKALETQGVSPLVTSESSQLNDADGVILPGVGSGPAAMDALRARGLVEPLKTYLASGKPFLGVCLGLQVLLDHTEEGAAACLGIVPGEFRKLPIEKLPAGQKVPHMGWNSVEFTKSHPILKDIPQGSYFYFVHSYYADPTDADAVAGITEYGVSFCSVYARGNLVATQFHPEKSGSTGLKIYSNFVSLAAEHKLKPAVNSA